VAAKAQLERDNLFERRAIGRTKISIQAKILFNKQQRPVIGHVHDATNNGARIQVDGLRLLPLTFELSFDNFKTARDCRLIRQNANLLGIAFLSCRPSTVPPGCLHHRPK
jgi:hypothetical protein